MARRATGIRFSSCLVLCMAIATIASAQQPATVPAAMQPDESADLLHAQAGVYQLDPKHVAVIARVLHRTFSYSVFRFGAVKATLEWDPGSASSCKLSATVQTGSIETNVDGFPKQITQFLKSEKFPEATFVSTAFRSVDATHEQVDGQFTLMGKTLPVTFDVDLVGAGPGFTPGGIMGHVIGIHAETSIHPQDFKLPDMLGESVRIVVDTEFDKVP